MTCVDESDIKSALNEAKEALECSNCLLELDIPYVLTCGDCICRACVKLQSISCMHCNKNVSVCLPLTKHLVMSNMISLFKQMYQIPPPLSQPTASAQGSYILAPDTPPSRILSPQIIADTLPTYDSTQIENSSAVSKSQSVSESISTGDTWCEEGGGYISPLKSASIPTAPADNGASVATCATAMSTLIEIPGINPSQTSIIDEREEDEYHVSTPQTNEVSHSAYPGWSRFTSASSYSPLATIQPIENQTHAPRQLHTDEVESDTHVSPAVSQPPTEFNQMPMNAAPNDLATWGLDLYESILAIKQKLLENRHNSHPSPTPTLPSSQQPLTPVTEPSSTEMHTKKRPRALHELCIFTTGVSADTKKALDECFRNGYFSLSDEKHAPRVTIVETVGSKRMCERTLSYVKSICLGHWIVDSAWLTSCLRNNKMMDYSEHEIIATIHDTALRGPMRSRRAIRDTEGRSQLLKQFDIVAVNGDVPKGALTMAEASWLIYYCGGTVVSFVKACRDCVHCNAEESMERIDETSQRTLLYLCLGDAFTGEGNRENCKFCSENKSKKIYDATEVRHRDVLVVGMSWLLLTVCNFSV